MVEQLAERNPQENLEPRLGSLDPDWTAPGIKLLNFDNIREKIQKDEDLRIQPEPVSNKGRGLPDYEEYNSDVVDLRSLRFTAADSVQVPGFGILEMTPWAKRQLGNELGVRWEKFFGGQDPEKIQRAITDHLRIHTENVPKKIIAKKHREERAGSQGLLRAFVGKGYEEIRDARLMDRMDTTIGRDTLKDMGFCKYLVNDVGTHLCLVHKEPIDIAAMAKGGLMTRRGFRGRGFRGHEATDNAYFGLRIRNSEVGAYSLTGDGYLLRIICTNGLIDFIEGERWLYRQHRRIGDENLDPLIDDMFERLPEQRERIIKDSALLRSKAVDDPEADIRSFLRSRGQPQVIQEAAVRAYQEEPNPTYFGVLQAITRLAMAIRRKPDRQYDIERLAGQYLHYIIPKIR